LLRNWRVAIAAANLVGTQRTQNGGLAMTIQHLIAAAGGVLLVTYVCVTAMRSINAILRTQKPAPVQLAHAAPLKTAASI
jgi:hypothetical protein